MAKKARRRRTKRMAWTRAHIAELRRYSKDKLQVKKISRLMKRTIGALRQKARALGIRLGHRQLKRMPDLMSAFDPKRTFGRLFALGLNQFSAACAC